MAYVKFVGNAATTNGTSFAALDDPVTWNGYGGFGEFITSLTASNLQLGASLHKFAFDISPDTPGMTRFSGVNLLDQSSTSFLDISATAAFYAPLTDIIITDDVLLNQVVRAYFANILKGSDTFEISGTLKNFYGDYLVAPIGTTAMGDDSIQIAEPLTIDASVSAITIFGDAQSVGVGRTAHGGDDNFELVYSTTAFVIYGDFQSVSGVATYGNDVIFSGNGADRLYGDGGNSITIGGKDILRGFDGADELYGNGGNDNLDGGTGSDILDGGEGYDYVSFLLIGFMVGTMIADLENQSLNTLEAAGDTYLSIEAISGRDYGWDDLRGNDLTNTLRGLKGNDILSGRGGDDKLFGGLGNDALSGSTGADRFYFDTALDGMLNVDTISTVSSLDRIILDNDIFTALGTSFTASEYRSIASGSSFSTVDSSDNIIYLKAEGELYYDADGSGVVYAPIRFANLTNSTTLLHSQFVMIE